MFEELEPRLLLSADWNAVLGDPAPLEEPAIVQFASLPATNDPAASVAATQHKELVVIDVRVPDYAALVNDFLSQTTSERGFEFLVLNERDDGISRVSSALVAGETYAAVHLVSHGADGSVQLGSTSIDAESLVSRAGGFQQWASGLSEDADILIYGCNVAATEQGQALVTVLSNLTGADVAASEDETGAAARGGDWDLEYGSGNIDTAVALSTSFQQEWNGLLLTYTVINADDSGLGSLRNAIDLVNASLGVFDTISFNIAGAGPHTINLASALPAIIDAVVIDGTTDPDFAGTPIIELNGASAGAGADGLVLDAGSSGSTIRGLVINRFADKGIFITNGSGGNLIAGNYIGTDVTGLVDLGNNGWGIDLINAGNDNVIGGDTAAERNVISGNNYGGIAVNGLISGTVIQGNYIGVGTDGTTALGNSGSYSVLLLNGPTNTKIGGTLAGEGNIIANNASDGVEVQNGTAAILGNSIYGNSGLGIDLGPDGVTANDNNDGDSGANDLQNFPVLTSAVTSGGNTRIQGTLNSTSGDWFRIEFFASPTGDVSGYGEGRTYLGFTEVQTSGNDATIDVTLTGVTVTAGYQVTATATRLNGGMGSTPLYTSEFAQNIAVNTAPTITSNGGGASAAVSIAENAAAVTTVTATDADLPAQTLTYAIAGGADAALFTINGSSGALSFTAAPNFEAPSDANGDNVYEVTVQVSDGALTDTQQISVTVTNVNEAPAGSNGSVTATEDTAYTFTIGDFGFTDVDAGDALAAVRVDALPAAGTLTLSGAAVNVNDVIAVADIVAGNLVFTPALNDNGSPYANFDFSVRDAGGLFAAVPATLTINVTPANDAPVANDDSFSITEDGALTVAAPGLLANDSDADGDALGIASYTNTANGNLLANPDGSFTYTPNADFTGTDTFSYTGSDGNGGLATASVTITVTAVNDAPVLAANNGMSLNNTVTGTITAARLGVSDVDNTAAQTVYTLTAVPASGVLRLNGVTLGVNDTFTQADIDANRLSYEHLDLSTSNAAFTFTVADGAGGAIGANSFAITVTFDTGGAGGPGTPPASDPGDVPPPAITPVDPIPESIGGGADDEPLAHVSHGSSAIAARATPRVLRAAVQTVEDHGQPGAVSTYTRDATPEQPVSRRLGEVLDVLRRHAGSDEPAGRHANLIAKSVQGSSLVLTAGFVSWLLRSGALATSLAATTPAWKGFDPLPILACRGKEKEGDDVQGRLDAVRDREEREARRFFNHEPGGPA